ncbi:MAG: inositol monophosphatase family protein, partial [Bacillota bacterium]|nr:inositol monophosphatase family protein [Bacillota bacterium]
MNKRNDIKVLKDLAVAAGQAIMKVYETDFAVVRKADDSPLTLADKTANEIIITGLRRAFPDYAILSEESRDDLSRLQNEY